MDKLTAPGTYKVQCIAGSGNTISYLIILIFSSFPFHSIMIGRTLLPVSLLLSNALAITPCPIQGPDYPAPSGLAEDVAFKDIIGKISQSLDNATEQSNALLSNLRANETSYSVIVFDAKSTLLSYHHTADALALAPESVSEVTG
jgi:hypothetical protein